ncbi:hypothetical protein [Mycobacterium lepromatosis]|uniref:hypothetical protein n=1 Tax=Mycobacterium lepromatosis TaxID=480418 RepID=UPI0012E0809F|nr:hypothetical protein [Mycobacterium lepromatosis]
MGFLRAELGPVAPPTPMFGLPDSNPLVATIAWFGAAASNKLEFRFCHVETARDVAAGVEEANVARAA